MIAELTAEPLPRLTSRTLGAGGLRDGARRRAREGLARERDEAVLGEASVAAPIFDHGGHAVGAIGVVGRHPARAAAGTRARSGRGGGRGGAGDLARARRGPLAERPSYRRRLSLSRTSSIGGGAVISCHPRGHSA